MSWIFVRAIAWCAASSSREGGLLGLSLPQLRVSWNGSLYAIEVLRVNQYEQNAHTGLHVIRVALDEHVRNTFYRSRPDSDFQAWSTIEIAVSGQQIASRYH
jgi:hypothetical protein